MRNWVEVIRTATSRSKTWRSVDDAVLCSRHARRVPTGRQAQRRRKATWKAQGPEPLADGCGPSTVDEKLASDRETWSSPWRLFDPGEIGLLRRAAKEDNALDDHSSAGRTAKAAPSASPCGITPATTSTACSRAAGGGGTCEQILGGEVYHYHTKMMLKEPRVGGAWEWHQDYGYWYHNGCLFPLISPAPDRGRPRHPGERLPASAARLAPVRAHRARQPATRPAPIWSGSPRRKRMELVHVEAEPGDVLFFHCNLLHRSDQNRSENPRWSLICCYNAPATTRTRNRVTRATRRWPRSRTW